MKRWWAGPAQGWLVWGLSLELLMRSGFPALDHFPHFWSSWPFDMRKAARGLLTARPLPSSLQSSPALPSSPPLPNFCLSLRCGLNCFFLRTLLPTGPRLSGPSVPLQHHQSTLHFFFLALIRMASDYPWTYGVNVMRTGIRWVQLTRAQHLAQRRHSGCICLTNE